MPARLFLGLVLASVLIVGLGAFWITQNDPVLESNVALGSGSPPKTQLATK